MQAPTPSASRRRLRGRLSLRAEAGGVLIEVMVSAVMVVMIATAVFKSIDAASAVSGSNKSKNVATSLAQEKLDQLRAMDPDKLSNYRGLTDFKTVDSIKYTIASRADWITDSTGGKSCASGAPGDYLKLYVSVTWPAMTATDRPVEAQTISTQPNGTYNNDGNLAIQITDAANTGVQGIDVSITGSSNLTDTTDENGCAFFGHLKPGSYTGSFNRAGYVDMQGVNPQGGTWTVVADQTTLKQYRYDMGASADVEFRTKIGTTTYDSNGQYVTFFHTNRTLPLQVGNTTYATSLTGNGLFPFTTAYSVYAGKAGCAGNNTAALATSVLLPSPTNPITVKNPPVNIQIRQGSTPTNITDGNTKALVRVTHTPTTSGCYDSGTFRASNAGQIPRPDNTEANTTITNGFPPAQYTVCVQYPQGSTPTQRKITKTVDTTTATDGSGNTSTNFDFTTSTATGTC